MLCILDIKSGKVQPWTAIQLAAYSLLDSPVEFETDGHIYTLNGMPTVSVTRVLAAEGFVDSTYFNDYVRDRGTYIHLACHLDNTGELDENTVGEVERPYLEAWRQFKRESGLVVESSEIALGNHQLHYAGTIDCIGEFPNGRLRRAAVELHNDATYKLIPYSNPEDINVWKMAISLFHWKRNNLRR